MYRYCGIFCILFLVCIFNCSFLLAGTTPLSSLPQDLQLQLTARQQGAVSGLHLSEDAKKYIYSAPAIQAGGSHCAAYTAELSNDNNGSLGVTANGTEMSVRLIPMMPDLGSAMRVEDTLSYSRIDGTRLTYSFKRNGVKEDVAFPKAPSKDVGLKYFVKLDPSLEGKMDAKGNLLVYGPPGALSGFVQTGDDKSAGLVLKARQHAPKNSLLYIIPAPVLVDATGAKSTSVVHFSYDAPFLTIHNSDLSSFSAPVTIDPSIVVTTTADFLSGNDEGMISFDTDAISRGVQTGGTIGDWNLTTSLNPGRSNHTSVAYNGYLYVIGGGENGGFLNDVQYASINSDGTLGSWNITTSFSTARYGHTSVAYNGFLYVIGGYDGSPLNDVQYTQINANGTLGTWNTTTTLTIARIFHTSVADNGYLYVMGGYNSGYLKDVQFAPINSNGTIGAWNSTKNLNIGRDRHTSVAYNGYLYVIGGFSSVGSLNDVQYAE
ncbi:MAG: hypothetical protein C5B54_02695, partial [Acidobacteria bacterium]